MEDKKAWIYIHIPKTAGRFIRLRVKESKDTSKIVIPFANNLKYSLSFKYHSNISFVRQQIELANDGRVGFVVIVRNPYDRMYSMWKWCSSHVLFDSVVDPVCLCFPNVKENFEDFLLNLKNGKYDFYHCMQKQTSFFAGGEDRFVKTMKFEELNTTVKTFFENNGVTWSDEKVNETGEKNYREVYNTLMRDIVIERCHEEFEKFNYSLDLQFK